MEPKTAYVIRSTLTGRYVKHLRNQGMTSFSEREDAQMWFSVSELANALQKHFTYGDGTRARLCDELSIVKMVYSPGTWVDGGMV